VAEVDQRARAWRLVPSVLLGLMVLLAGLPSAAAADHRGGPPIGSFLPCDRPVDPPRCTSVGNDIWHFVYIDESVPRGLAASIRRSMAQVYDPTHLEMIVQTRITDATDVIVYAADWGANGAAGWVYCPADAPQGTTRQGDRWCQRQEMHFNLNPRYAAFFDDRASRDYMACHELGHTIGLRHWGNPPHSDGPIGATCMNPDVPNGPVTLHRFDRQHINRYYALPEPRLCQLRMLEETQPAAAPVIGALRLLSGPLPF
jgi:hypothetical protein